MNADQLTLGQALRDEGIARVDAVEPEVWKDLCDDAIEIMASIGVDFTAEDIRLMVGDPVHPNAMGSRFLKAARAGLIVRTGFRKSARPSRHTNPSAVWRGVPSPL